MAKGFTNSGTITAPCPRCGASGYVPSGKFKNNKDILLALIREIEYTDIRSMQSDILRHIDNNKSPNGIKKYLKKKYPKYRKVWDNSPQETKDMILFLGWLLGVLGSLITIWSQVSGMSDEELTINIINPNINYHFENDASQPESPEEKQKPKPRQYKT